MAQTKLFVNGVLCVLLFIALDLSSAASRVVDSGAASGVVFGNEGPGSEDSLVVPGEDRQSKYLITPLSFGNIFPNQNETGGNSTNPFPTGQVATSVAVVKTLALAALGALKAALPQAILLALVFGFLISGIAFFVCSLTDCGISPLSVRGSSPYDNDILNRNSFDYDYEKFRPVYHAIDDHKYKYNQIHQDKEIYAAPSN